MQFVPATCPTCSGQLQLPDNVDNVKCMYCGNNIVVKKAIQAGASVNIDNFFKLARSASNAGNADEAYQYYTKILEVDHDNSEAWMGKAESAAWMSTLRDFRIPEMLSGFQNAVQFAPEDRKNEVKKGANRGINKVSMAMFTSAYNHMLEFVTLDNSWPEYLNQCEILLKAFQEANKYDPKDRLAIENIIHICTTNIQGVLYSDPYNNGASTARHVADSYENELRKLRDRFGFKLKQIDPTFQLPPVKRQSPGACFVATATMGDPNHPDVVLLRYFRDSVLVNFKAGKAFIHLYYSFGPLAAGVIAQSNMLKSISRILLIGPISRCVSAVILRSKKMAPTEQQGLDTEN